jgi:4-amino-4-deoxy-L-arabinose transferase-like glycosyltransferase
LRLGSCVIEKAENRQARTDRLSLPGHPIPLFFFALCLFVLFFRLGGAAFFEPDEGRNAEKAREILLLKDWVTPHENFIPVLDKPILFYWLIAVAYKAFGISEWSARLPSALAALGCLFLVYRFARAHGGIWAGLWSALILVTSVEFFVLARVVISDMTLTLWITLALHSFYFAVHAKNEKTRNIQCLLLYGALAAGTLTKGLIGLFIPGMIFFSYLFLTRRWKVLRQMHLVPGALLYLAIMMPWYLWADARNPGYLRYFLLEEHFNRYLTEKFERAEPWYYFFAVFTVGFLPWTMLLPYAVKNLWKEIDDRKLFLILSVLLPFVFFSVSKSKMPHYILPIYPAVAILCGQMVAGWFHRSKPTESWMLYLPWIPVVGCVFYFMVGGFWPYLLPERIRGAVIYEHFWVVIFGAAILFIQVGFSVANRKGYWKNQRAAFLCASASLALFLSLAVRVMAPVSLQRSAKALASHAVAFVTEGKQMVLYDTYLTGLPFYLRVRHPIWVVVPEDKTTVMGSPYISSQLPDPAPGYGQVLFRFSEFVEMSKTTDKPLLIFAKTKNVDRLESQVGTAMKELARVDEYVLVSKPHTPLRMTREPVEMARR